MTPAARIAAAADLLDQILAGTPAEKALTGWARRSRFAGSKDRAALRDLVYDALRCRRSHAWLGGAETGRGLMLGGLIAAGTDPATLFTGDGHAPAPLSDAEATQAAQPPALTGAPEPVACDMPDWLWPLLTASLGDQTRAVCQALRHRAPVFLRVNLRKGDRDRAIASLARDGVEAREHPQVATALEVTSGPRRVAQSAAYLDGLVELQDAASQDVTAQIPLRDGMTVLDYCAGGGGKTLAMAARADARFTAHDANPARLADLPARATRAGVEVTVTDRPQGPFDLVLTDVPCSGSGSWRRAPEAKWTLTAERLSALNTTQDQILDQAAALVAPGGSLAYVTCSILACENGDRAAAFLARHDGWRMEEERHWHPDTGGDGFYLARFTRVTV
ncbi:RsmB/NOP family class I SAM-dependent RNA methyltransferase [Pseudooceanicola sp.]|uniref:RsmB/NOP family class I SAM-dependent RNA methyltransferase n=1 Tax=Pseudooceanicola sp. TaxID=1914328 RepID=UPI0035C732C4